MDHFKQKYVYSSIEGKSFTYFRYINDIFLIWTRTKNELGQFFKDLSEKHASIKFDPKAPKDCIVFLDTEIYLHNGKLRTKICRKENYQQHYLHIKSEHRKSLKNSLPYSQPITVKRKVQIKQI